MRGGKLVSVNNFSAQEYASPKNRYILNFRVMAVRDRKAMNVFVEKYQFTDNCSSYFIGRGLTNRSES